MRKVVVVTLAVTAIAVSLAVVGLLIASAQNIKPTTTIVTLIKGNKTYKIKIVRSVIHPAEAKFPLSVTYSYNMLNGTIILLVKNIGDKAVDIKKVMIVEANDNKVVCEIELPTALVLNVGRVYKVTMNKCIILKPGFYTIEIVTKNGEIIKTNANIVVRR